MALKDTWGIWATSFTARIARGWADFLDDIDDLVSSITVDDVTLDADDYDGTFNAIDPETLGQALNILDDITYASITENDGDTDVTAAELEELTDGSETSLHSHAGGDAWTYVYLSSDFTTSLAADTAVSNFYFTPAAGELYVVEGNFLLRTATTTVGARPGVSWPTGTNDGAAWVTAPNSYTAAANRFIPAGTTQNAASTGLASTSVSFLGTLWATFITGATPSGNFQITLRTETAGTNVTMKLGSWIRYRTVG